MALRRLMSLRFWLLTAVGFALASLVASATGSSPPPPPGLHAVHPPIPAPAFRLPRVTGGTLSAAELQGKVIVVRFWATW